MAANTSDDGVAVPSVRRRRPARELRNLMIQVLKERGEPTTIPELRAAIVPVLGEVPPSSIRSTLQDVRFFERVSRGVFRAK